MLQMTSSGMSKSSGRSNPCENKPGYISCMVWESGGVSVDVEGGDVLICTTMIQEAAHASAAMRCIRSNSKALYNIVC